MHRTPRAHTAPHCPVHKPSHRGMDCSRGRGGSPAKSQCPPKDPQPRSSAFPGVGPKHRVLNLTKMFQISVLAMGNLSEDHGEDWALGLDLLVQLHSFAEGWTTWRGAPRRAGWPPPGSAILHDHPKFPLPHLQVPHTTGVGS